MRRGFLPGFAECRMGMDRTDQYFDRSAVSMANANFPTNSDTPGPTPSILLACDYVRHDLTLHHRAAR